MFTAKFIQPYRHGGPFTKGATYTVIDFNEYLGTYTVLNDDGARANVDWMRFEDQGRAIDTYRAVAA